MYDFCSWEKTSFGYRTDCGHETRNRDSRNFKYCPFCGHSIIKSRKEYNKNYYAAKKAAGSR